MSWEQDISKKIDELENSAVRFDVQQHLSNTQKLTAKTNIEIGSSAKQIEGDNYKITLN